MQGNQGIVQGKQRLLHARRLTPRLQPLHCIRRHGRGHHGPVVHALGRFAVFVLWTLRAAGDDQCEGGNGEPVFHLCSPLRRTEGNPPARTTHRDRSSELPAKIGLTREAFANHYGFSRNAVRDWEQGVRRPEKAARTLLLVIDRSPRQWSGCWLRCKLKAARSRRLVRATVVIPTSGHVVGQRVWRWMCHGSHSGYKKKE